MGTEIWETNRRIRSHILSHTRSISHLTVQPVLVNAVRSGRLADVAGSARKHQTVVDTVFFWIKQVGAVKNLLVDYRRVEGAQKKQRTIRDRNGNGSGRTCYHQQRKETDWQTCCLSTGRLFYV